MKLVLALLVALLWQAGDFGGGSVGPVAEPQHLRYERSLTLPAGASGMACAVLDAQTFAHAASWSGGDLRVFRSTNVEQPGAGQRGGSEPEEVPFAVSYSAAQPTDAVTATVHNARLQNGAIAFDLDMPRRAYTDVDLRLAARDFIGTAVVSGSDGQGGAAKPLGTFTLFDLTGEHLARSTSLALQESSFAQLHVVLRLHGVQRGALPKLTPDIVEGAAVPASREAQTLYTVVATTGKVTQKGSSTDRESVGEINAPAHVPVERVSFVLDSAFKGDFLRSVSVAAIRDARARAEPTEVIDGEIWRVTRAGDVAGEDAIHAAKLTLDAVIASNLRDGAKVYVEVKNGSQPPLPIKAIDLEMRQRTICFDASPGATYTLRYGDKGVRATVYDLGPLGTMQAEPILATLGPEELNRHYVARIDSRTYDERNPERYWILLLGVIAMLGALGSRHTKRRGKHR